MIIVVVFWVIHMQTIRASHTEHLLATDLAFWPELTLDPTSCVFFSFLIVSQRLVQSSFRAGAKRRFEHCPSVRVLCVVRHLSLIVL